MDKFKFSFYFLLILPFVNCHFDGLNIMPGTCPNITGDANTDIDEFGGVWIISQCSTTFLVDPKDCQVMSTIPNGKNAQFFFFFYDQDSELVRGFQGQTIYTAPGIFTFSPSKKRDNHMMKGRLTVLATDNDSYAVILQCFEILGHRVIIVRALIKDLNPPADYEETVNEALRRNGVDLALPLSRSNLHKNCQIPSSIFSK